MSNEVQKFAAGGNLPENIDDVIGKLEQFAAGLGGANAGGLPYLRLTKTGVFAFGAEAIEPEPGSEWAINPNSLQHGYACWMDGQLQDERMVPWTQPVPAQADLPDYGDDWSPATSIVLQCVSGEDKGQAVLYKGTSIGLANAVKAFSNELITQLRDDRAHPVAIVHLEVDSYTHKKYGKIFTPVFDVVRWVGFDGTDTGQPTNGTDDSTPDATADEKPAAGRRRRRRD